MFHVPKLTFCAIGLTAISTVATHADGVDPMYDEWGGYIDDIEIVGDVTVSARETLALLEMPEQRMKFFIDPDAVYVTMDPNNPIFTEQTPFYGYWISTQSVDISDWPACDYQLMDENGTPHEAHGTLVWTNLGIGDDGYSLAFRLDIGLCDAPEYPWAYSLAALEMAGPGGVPHDDVEPQDAYRITDANGDSFWVEVTTAGARLVAEHAAEEFEMLTDCSASSPYRGIGSWGWANGGFIVDFDTASFSFPRMDAPVEDDGRCRF